MTKLCDKIKAQTLVTTAMFTSMLLLKRLAGLKQGRFCKTRCKLNIGQSIPSHTQTLNLKLENFFCHNLVQQQKCENLNHTNIEKCHRFDTHHKYDNNDTHHLYWIISIPNKPELKDY